MDLKLMCFSSIFLIIIIHSSSMKCVPSRDSKLPNMRYQPVTIDIDTKRVRYLSTSKPLSLTVNETFPLVLLNTGKSVQTLNDESKSAFAQRGVLKDDQYARTSFGYYWEKNISSHAMRRTTIDGENFPYEVRVLWIKNKYSTISEAVRHPDGCFELVLLFRFCSIENKFFQKMHSYVKKIQRAGSSILIPSVIQIGAANFIPEDSSYYSYKGQFMDMNTGRKYRSSTVVVIVPNDHYCLTEDQLVKSFGMTTNYENKSLKTSLPHDPFCSNIEVSCCSGVTQDLFL